MAANNAFQLVNESGWRAGLGNLLRKESRDWWGTRRWWMQALIWTLIVDGTLLSVLTTLRPASEMGAATNGQFEDLRSMGLMMYATMGGLFVALGGILSMQGEILDEKKLGTAAWILSKPVSRSAFVLAKLLANAASQWVLMIVVPGAGAYGLLTLNGYPLPIGLFVVAWGLIFLHLMFYLTLTLLLGTLSDGRGAVIGIPLLILLGFQFVLQVVPALGAVMPWALVTATPGITSAGLVVDLLKGQPLATTPLVMTAVWCVIFTVAAVWRFKREEL